MSQSSRGMERSRGSRGTASSRTTPTGVGTPGEPRGRCGQSTRPQRHPPRMSLAHPRETVLVSHVPTEASPTPQTPGAPLFPARGPPTRESLSKPAYLSDSLGVPLGLGTGGSCSLPRWERRMRQAFLMGGCGLGSRVGHCGAAACPPFLPGLARTPGGHGNLSSHLAPPSTRGD